MNALDIQIEGIGFWAQGWPDWERAQLGLRGEIEALADAARRPATAILTPVERRRAPDPVMLACEIAAQACAASGRDPATLTSVFASTHGDLVITDYMCATLATAPRELSPIRFHNSVHNAPAGYWTIAAKCHAASTSISGWHASFGSALFEAAVEAIAEDKPVLLVTYDTESKAALQDVSPASAMFGVALVIAPAREGHLRLRISTQPLDRAQASEAQLPASFAQLAASNPMAATALPFLHALATGRQTPINIASSVQTAIQTERVA